MGLIVCAIGMKFLPARIANPRQRVNQGMIMCYREGYIDLGGYLSVERIIALTDAATGLDYGSYGQDYRP